MSLVSAALNRVDRLLGAEAHRKRQRQKMLAHLLDDKSKGATGICDLDRLAQTTGMTPKACRALLEDMGCEPVTTQDGHEGWKRTDPK